MKTTVQNRPQQYKVFTKRQNAGQVSMLFNGALLDVNAPILSWEISSGRIVVSSGWGMLTGYDNRGSLINPEQLYSLLSKKDLAGFVHFIKSMTYGNNHEDSSFECHIRHRDGVFIPVKMLPLIIEHGEDGNVASVILLCDPVSSPGFIIPDEGEVAGEWSIMFSVNHDGTIYPAKFWMSENYKQIAGLDDLHKTFTIDDWIHQIAEEDQKKMKKHMLSLMNTNDSSSMITYKLNTGDEDYKRVFSMATALVDELNGNLHVKAVDWFIPEKEKNELD